MSGVDPSELSDADRAEILLALTPDVGPILRGRLLEHFGDAASVITASEVDLQQVQGIGPKISAKIINARHEVQLEAQLALAREHGLGLLLPGRPGYPRLLAEIPDPPGVLFLRGDIEPGDAMAVGIVGTRRASRYGMQQAERLAAGLARAGVAVVSGLARGIDAAAHRGALAAGGRTIAVLASGVLNVFPPEHAKLAEEVAAHGAVVSEAAPTMPPLAGMFPQRNRIISGMTLGRRTLGYVGASLRRQSRMPALGQFSCPLRSEGRSAPRPSQGRLGPRWAWCHAIPHQVAKSGW
jgi:DNA processing protein